MATGNDLACRFCRHRVGDHNNICGCTSPICRCAGTRGEAGPRTNAELDVVAIPLSRVLPSHANITTTPDVREETPTEQARRFAEHIEVLGDEAKYRAIYASTERHPCPVTNCRLSAEEHHRLAYGILAENRALKARLRALENGPGPTARDLELSV